MTSGEGAPLHKHGRMGKIVLSAGMPRAGSGWYYNLIHDLVVAAGGQNSRQIRQRFYLKSVLTEVNCNIGTLSLPRLGRVLIPAALGNTFTIKVHSGPTRTAEVLMKWGWLIPIYIYRDPRDALLSAYEFGRRVLQERGRPNAFSRLSTIDMAIDYMADYMRPWQGWVECPYGLVTRYEDLVDDYETQAMRLIHFLRLDGKASSICEVIERYRPDQGQAGQKGLHFSKGRVGRFRQVLTAEQQVKCSKSLGPFLDRMGYPLV